MADARRALIIGNTDGIGLALTRLLLADGWMVAGISRRASPLGDAPGYRHTVADVSTAVLEPALRTLLGSEAAFDVCVYCAGIGELLDLSNLAGEPHVFRVNLVGAVETAAAVVPSMIAAGRGHFDGLSSIGDGVSPQAPSYAASKAGLSTERAVDVILRCLRRRPARFTYPKRMAALVKVLGWLTSIRLWFA